MLYDPREKGQGLVEYAYGIETNLPFGIDLWGAIRYPTQLFDFIFGLIILWIIWPHRVQSIVARGKSGIRILFFLALSSCSFLFTEAFRASGPIIFGSIKSVQIISWIVLAISLWGLYKLSKSKNLNQES